MSTSKVTYANAEVTWSDGSTAEPVVDAEPIPPRIGVLYSNAEVTWSDGSTAEPVIDAEPIPPRVGVLYAVAEIVWSAAAPSAAISAPQRGPRFPITGVTLHRFVSPLRPALAGYDPSEDI